MSRDPVGTVESSELELLRSENARLRARLDQQLGAQQALAQGLGATQQLGSILRTTLDHAIALSKADAGGIYLLDEAGERLELASHRGVSLRFAREVQTFPALLAGPKELLTGRALNKTAASLEAIPLELWEAEGLAGLFAQPVAHGERVLGAMVLLSRSDPQPGQGRQRALELVGRQLGAALERSRSRAERALLARVVESSFAGIGLCSLDGTTRYVNTALLAMWGYTSPDQLVGGSVFDWWDDQTTAQEYFRRILEQGRITDQLTGRRADGTLFPVVGTACLLEDEQGGPGQVVGSFIDVTELQRGREALRQVTLVDAINRLLRQALVQDGQGSIGPATVQVARTLTGAGVGLLVVLEEGRVAETFLGHGGSEPEGVAALDPCRLLGVAPEGGLWGRALRDGRAFFVNDVPAHVAAQSIPEEHLAIDNLLFSPMLQGEEVKAMLVLGNRPGGFDQEQLEVALTMAPAVLQILGFQRSKRQVTKQEAMLRQGQRLEAIGRLAGGVAHDFNNLLAVVTMFGQGLMESLDPGGQRYDDARTIVETAERGAQLTRQLLAFGRRAVLQPVNLRAGALVLEMETMIRRLLGDAVELEVHADPDSAWINADPGEMGQVLMNLVVNARDAMPQGGRLRISVHDHPTMFPEPSLVLEPGDYVELRVSDSGQGISAAELEHIFEPFYTTKDMGKGTGLGLATVYGIVRQSGGGIKVESEPGRGATFRIFLPRVLGDASDVPVSTGSLSGGRGRETVLLAEDNEQVRRGACRALARAGYRVLEAANAGEALLISEQFDGPIHALVTDVDMPRVDGPRLAQRLHQARPDVRVLFFTGHGGDALAESGFDLQRSRCLLKPFSPHELTSAVRSMLDERRGAPGDERA